MTKTNQCIEVLPKLSIFNFYVKSIFLGLWILFKWLIYYLWNFVNQKRSVRDNLENSQIYNNSDNYFHDKPPPCLVDNSYGRHSYVKLKVNISLFKSVVTYSYH